MKNAKIEIRVTTRITSDDCPEVLLTETKAFTSEMLEQVNSRTEVINAIGHCMVEKQTSKVLQIIDRVI